MYKYCIFLILILGALFSNTTSAQVKDIYSYHVIKAPNNTWGYDIYKENKLVIHQTSKPAIEGNMGFSSVSKAQAVATIIIKKLRAGIIPPTITRAEIENVKDIN